MADLSVKLDVSDLKKLQKDIESVVKTVTKEGEGSVIAKAALAIERQAKINATGRPGPMVRTGRLRASIIPRIISYTEAEVGTNVEYAPFVEFGHSQQVGRFVPAIQRRLVNSSAPAYPYLYPAVEQCKSELDGIFVSFSNEIEGDWQ